MVGPTDIRTFPSGDASFAALVRACAEQVDYASPGELERALRGHHPRARVRWRAQLAAPRGYERMVWYAFRDGEVLPPRLSDNGTTAPLPRHAAKSRSERGPPAGWTWSASRARRAPGMPAAVARTGSAG